MQSVVSAAAAADEPRRPVAEFLEGGGEAGALIAARDWSQSPIGPIECWPQSLRTALSMVLHSPVPIVMLWGPDGVMLYNDAYSELAGSRHPDLLGSSVREGWPEVADFNDNVMKVCLAGGRLSYRNMELTLHSRGRVEQVWMNLDYSPIFDEAGRPAGVMAIVAETTEQVRAQAELKAQNDRLRNVLEGMGDGFLLLSHDFTILEINAEGARVEGRPREALVGRNHWEVWPDTWDAPLGRTYRRAMVERTPFTVENRYTWNDREAWLDVRGYPVNEGLAIFYRDVSDKKRTEEHLKLMINELNHRVKNSLATVQAIADQTLRRSEAPEAVRETLTQRLKALAQAHDVLTDEKWTGADLRDLALQAAAPYGGLGFVIEGPPVTLPAKTAIAMALAFHELATNAVKYGALSRPCGRVEIRWTVSTGRLHLTWREHGGPKVQPPRQSGFGTRLIERTLSAEFEGGAKLAFERRGLVCEIDAALPPIPAALPH